MARRVAGTESPTPIARSEAPAPIARVDLHCHTRASFDSRSDPAAVAARAAERGLTHLAITDHGTCAGAEEVSAAAPDGLTVITGCEVATSDGDLIFLFVDRPPESGLTARRAIEAGRAMGALVGIPHPFDASRNSLLVEPRNEPLLELVDWVEGVNGRVASGTDNERAIRLGRRHGLPSIGASDAHTLLEIGLVVTAAVGDPSTPDGLRAWLRQPLAVVGPGLGPR